jgi:hypothetical protein
LGLRSLGDFDLLLNAKLNLKITEIPNRDRQTYVSTNINRFADGRIHAKSGIFRPASAVPKGGTF